MSKSGRYSADRKKVATLTDAASRTGVIADCGTIFLATGASGTTLYTLPTIAVAGKGWWAKFVKTGAAGAGGAINIQAHADDGDTPIIGVICEDVNTAVAHDDLTIIDGADPGSQWELVCDGSQWIALGFSTTDSDIASS